MKYRDLNNNFTKQSGVLQCHLYIPQIGKYDFNKGRKPPWKKNVEGMHMQCHLLSGVILCSRDNMIIM